MFDTQNSSLSIFRLVVDVTWADVICVFYCSLSFTGAMCWLSRPRRLSCHQGEWRMWVEWRLTSYATQTLHLSSLSFSFYPSSPPLPSFSSHLNQNSFRSHRGHVVYWYLLTYCTWFGETSLLCVTQAGSVTSLTGSSFWWVEPWTWLPVIIILMIMTSKEHSTGRERLVWMREWRFNSLKEVFT